VLVTLPVFFAHHSISDGGLIELTLFDGGSMVNSTGLCRQEGPLYAGEEDNCGNPPSAMFAPSLKLSSTPDGR